MANLTDVAADAALDNMGALFAELHTADPTDSGTAGRSVAFTARQSAMLGAAAARARANTQAVNWTGAAAAETITHVSLWDQAGTGGTCVWRGPLTTPVVVAAGDGAAIAAGALTMTLT